MMIAIEGFKKAAPGSSELLRLKGRQGKEEGHRPCFMKHQRSKTFQIVKTPTDLGHSKICRPLGAA